MIQPAIVFKLTTFISFGQLNGAPAVEQISRAKMAEQCQRESLDG